MNAILAHRQMLDSGTEALRRGLNVVGPVDGRITFADLVRQLRPTK